MHEREIEYTLRDFFGLLKRRIGTVIVIALIISAFFVFAALASHPVFIAKGSIQLVSKSSSPGLLGDLQQLTGGDTQIGSEIEIVRSRTVANAVIEEMSLRLKIEDVTYSGPFTRGFGFVFGDRLQRDLRSFRVEGVSFPITSEEKKYIVTFTDDSGGFKIRGPKSELGTGILGQVFKSDELTFTPTVMRGSKGTRFKLQPKDAWRTLLDFQDNLNATTLGGATRTNLIGISYRSADPSLASDVVNAVMNEYEHLDYEWRNQQGKVQTEQLESQLDEIRKSLREAETALQDYQNTHKVVTLPDEAKIAVTDLAQRESERIDLDLQLSIWKNIHDDLSSKVNGPDFAVPPTITADPVIQQLAQQHEKLMGELADLLLDYTENHPSVIAKNEAIMGVRDSILKTLSATVSGLEGKISDLETVINSLQTKLYEIPNVERELIDKTRDRDIADEGYRILLKRYLDAKLLESSLNLGNRVVDYATPPGKPAAPIIREMLLLGFGVGLVLGFLLALILEISDRFVRREDELEDLYVGGPIVAVTSGSESEITHAVSALALACMGIEPKILPLLEPGADSPKSREMIENIIARLSISLRPMIVIDAGIPVDETYLFGVKNQPGLSEMAAGKEVTPHSVGDGNVRVITGGATPSGAHISNKHVRDSVTKMAQGVPLTIAYASNLLTEPALRGWASMAGGVILIIRRNHELKAATTGLYEALKADGIKILGVLFLE